MAKRISGLDGIRALSILLVLFAHLGRGKTDWASHGVFGVESFFVLSGFLITWLLCVEEDRHGNISLPSFYARRALRILPPAFACILITWTVARLGFALVAPYEPLYCAFFVRNLMANGAVHLGHFWSLAIEEQFYLLWPVGFLLLRSDSKRLLFAGALFAAAPFWRQLNYKLAGGAMYVNSTRFDVRYDGLIIGCALALLRHHPQLQRFASSPPFRSSAAFLIGLAATVAGQAGLPMAAFASSLSFIGVAIIINFAVEREDGLVGSFLNAAPTMWLGRLSYSLYLWQQIFCYDSRIPWAGEFPQNAAFALAAASLSYLLLERPMAALRKRVPYIRNFGLGGSRGRQLVRA